MMFGETGRRGIVLAILTVILVGNGINILAAEGDNIGTFLRKGKMFTFTKLIAFRAEAYGEDRIVVFATSQPLPADVVEKIQEMNAAEANDVEVDQPYLKASFDSEGMLKSLFGRGGGLSFGNSGDSLKGTATISSDRIQGQIRHVEEGDFAREVTMKFDLRIGVDGSSPMPVKLDPPVKPSVSGKFSAGGKAADLKFVIVQQREEFGGKEAVRIVFTERNPNDSKDPGFDAGFGKLGNALILSVDTTGSIFGCEVAHTGHSKSPFSAIGEIQMTEFDLSTGNAKGKVSTGGAIDAFDEKWEAELTFAAPLPDKLRTAMIEGNPKKQEKKNSGKSSSKIKSDSPEKKATSVVSLK